MKTKRFLSAVVIVATVTFTSCNNVINDIADDSTPVAVQFSAGIEAAPQAQTYASGTSWSPGDAIGIFMVENGTEEIALGAENKEYTTTGNANFMAVAGDIYYPQSGDVDFIAYYPWQTGMDLTDPYEVDVSDQSDPEAIDLLWAMADNGGSGYNSGGVAFAFSHMLTRIVLTAVNGDGLIAADLTGMTAKISGMKTKADFELTDGTLVASNDVEDITLQHVAGKYEAILVPQSVASDAMEVTFTLDNGAGEFVWKVPATTFEAGKEYTYTITLNRSGEITFTGTINPWLTEDGGSGIAE